MSTCIACGMPLTKAEDCFGGDLNANICVHCAKTDGTPKPCAEIFEGGVQFFMGATGSPRDLAERLTRKNMNSLDYWKDHGADCLQGAEATEEEFGAVMAKLAG
jgi:hypothetical protein